jgi:protocatechuate 3,4-dioxygenase beta subunit
VPATRFFAGPPRLSGIESSSERRSETVADLDTTPRSRREVLGLFGGLGAALVLAGCGSDGTKRATSTTSTTASTTTTTSGSAATVASCAQVPEETGGPYPGDGTNGPNVLAQDGVVRSDIRSSFGSASGVAEGVPLTVELTVVDNGNGCAALPGAAVYIWHCDRDGQYSMYSQGVENENYLRGVQAADANGRVTFTSIFPAAYSGRWPHIHFEVFPDVDAATHGTNKIVTSQLALPADVCTAVYATDGYSQSVRNLARTSLATDMVFSDGASLQTPTVTGDPASGYTAKLVVGV